MDPIQKSYSKKYHSHTLKTVQFPSPNYGLGLTSHLSLNSKNLHIRGGSITSSLSALSYVQGSKAAIYGIKNILKKAPISRIYKTRVSQKSAETLNSPLWTVNEGAKNRAEYERFVKDIRESMQRPHVENSGLQDLMRQQYRPTSDIGSGSTAAAIIYERTTGQLVRGRSHVQKGNDDLVALRNWLRDNPTARPGDRAAAENVIADLLDALGDFTR